MTKYAILCGNLGWNGYGFGHEGWRYFATDADAQATCDSLADYYIDAVLDVCPIPPDHQ